MFNLILLCLFVFLSGSGARELGVPWVADSVEVTPDTLRLEVGDLGRATCIPRNSFGTVLATACAWTSRSATVSAASSLSPNVVSVSALTVGSTWLDATAGDGVDSIRVIVTAPPPPPPTVTSVSLTPSSASVATGATRQFAASTQWTDSVRAFAGTWSATGGTVSGTGLYTAGGASGSYRVIATEAGKADTASVTVTVTPTVVSVSLSPASATLDTGTTRQFTANTQWTDIGRAFAGVWSATGGTISGSGLYTAGPTAGAFRVVATEAGKADTSSVTVTAPPPPPPPPAGSCARTVNVATRSQLETAIASALAGDCIMVAAGTYSLTGNLTFSRNGTAAKPITIQGAGWGSTVIDGNGSQIFFNADYTYIRKLRITDLGSQGIATSGAIYNVFDSLEIDHTRQQALAFQGASHHNTVKNSKFHDTGTVTAYYGEAIYVSTSGSGQPLQFTNTDNQIIGNTFGPNVRANHIDIKEGGDRTLVKSNTFDGTGTIWDAAHGMGSLVDIYASNVIFEYNTMSKGAPNAVRYLTPSTVTMAGNIARNNTINLQNIHGAQIPFYGFQAPTNPAQATIKCNNIVTNGVFSNVVCTP